MTYPISAVIPVKNGMRFLPNFIESNSTLFESLNEVIFINDGSSDETYNFLSSKFQGVSRITVVDNPNPGLVNALNLGIRNSRSNWVARFDVDDEYSSRRFEAQYQLIGDDVGAIFSDYEVIDSSGGTLGVISSPCSEILTVLSLVNSRRTPHPVALLNKSAVLKVGGYFESEHPAEDLGLWLRLSRSGYKIKTCPEILLRYRIHEGSITSHKNFEMLQRKNELLSKQDFLGTYPQAIANWRIQMKLISNLPLGSQRKFLSCLDLLSLNCYAPSKHNLLRFKMLLLTFITLANPKVLLAGFEYYLAAKKRHRHRKL